VTDTTPRVRVAAIDDAEDDAAPRLVIQCPACGAEETMNDEEGSCDLASLDGWASAHDCETLRFHEDGFICIRCRLRPTGSHDCQDRACNCCYGQPDDLRSCDCAYCCDARAGP
jgi:hypothetical protein